MKNHGISSSGLLYDEPDLVCAYSNRHFKNMSLVYGDTKASLANRKNFLAPLGIDYRDLICAKQVHSDNIRYVTETDKGKGALSFDTSLADTDALVTDKRNLPIAIFTADCLSIFLYDPVRPAVGLVHAGWRSSKENIAAKTIRFMQEIFQTEPARVRALFGPAIGECCYEVGKDMDEYFAGRLTERNNRYYLDLAGINKRQLFDSGVKPDNVASVDVCTSCRNEDFFSYRREKETCARIMSVMMLK